MHRDDIEGMRILVTGAGGVLGKALLGELAAAGARRLYAPPRRELDLLNGEATARYIGKVRPDAVFHLAALVYGLAGNMRHQMAALVHNTRIDANLFSALANTPPAHVVMAGTVAAYPFPYARLPLREEDFFAGLPHTGEFGYAMAKRHAHAFIHLLAEEKGVHATCALLTNLYGEHDRFDTENGHAIPSLIARAHGAAQAGMPLDIWGDGNAVRDFLHARDAARALILCLKARCPRLINIASGQGVTIATVARIIADHAGVRELRLQADRPVGIQSRVVDNTRIAGLGFRQAVSIEEGLRQSYDWYAENHERARR